MIEGEENLLQYATDYYAELFGPAPEFNVQLDPCIWHSLPQLTVDENDTLCRPFSEEVIKMHYSK
jgi:hypothetical protein